eukprot:Nk52_evm80s1992 gene=Nk52_evmTU80s1992
MSTKTLLQIIDENYEFTPHVPEQLVSWGLSNLGFDYNITAILGCQSSGKSTLLNILFGTEFQEMNEDIGRQQTTQGVWLARSQFSNVLVLDVEGTDSKERGEEHINFERKSALFSLAVSEVLIINMWCADVGRYQAANYGLLKTVFDIHLQLFQQKGSPKTLLLFVLRDHTQKTPLEKLSGILKSDLKNIWEELQKPDEYASSELTDFFDWEFTSLPHKDLQEDQFYAKAGELKNRFNDKDCQEYLFNEKYHKKIPADGVGAFCEGVWDKVIHNQDLDIPTQKEMLAMYRCDEISKETYEEFLKEILPYRNQIESGTVVDKFGAVCAKFCTASLAKYDGPAKRYHADVYQNKKVALSEKMGQELNALFHAQMGNLVKKASLHFAELWDQKIGDNLCGHFAERSEECSTLAIKKLEGQCKESVMEGSDWSFEEHLMTLKQTFEKDIKAQRKVQEDLLFKVEKKELISSLGETLQELLNQANENMWEEIKQAYKDSMEIRMGELDSYMVGFKCPAEEREEWKSTLHKIAHSILSKKLQEAANFLQMKMIKRFEYYFKYDSNRVPRQWEQSDDISTYFISARKEADKLFNMFCSVELNPDDFGTNEKIVVMSPKRIEEVREQFESEIQPIFKDAIAAQRRNMPGAGVPFWIYGVMFILGYNELMAIISSPFMFVGLVLCAVAFYVLWKLQMIGPAMAVGRSVFAEVNKQVYLKLDQLNQPAQQGGRNRTRSSGSDEDVDARARRSSSGARHRSKRD